MRQHLKPQPSVRKGELRRFTNWFYQLCSLSGVALWASVEPKTKRTSNVTKSDHVFHGILEAFEILYQMLISDVFMATWAPADLHCLLPECISCKLGIFFHWRGAKVDTFQAWGRRCFLAYNGDERETSSRSHWREFPFCWHMSKAVVPTGWWEAVQVGVQCVVGHLSFLRGFFLMANISRGSQGKGQNGLVVMLSWWTVVGWWYHDLGWCFFILKVCALDLGQVVATLWYRGDG